MSLLSFADLRRKNVARCESPTGFRHPLKSWSPAEWGNATGGELGEAAEIFTLLVAATGRAQNISKKILRFRDNVADTTIEQLQKELAKEMGDVQVYLDLWAASAGIDLAVATIEVFNTKSVQIGCDIKL